MNMKLSVLMITYNQRRYIAQAIESVLMQETNFDWEIVIGDDGSSDGTREIVADYATRYPGKIRALLHPHNLGLCGVRNFDLTYKHCRSRYIALLEGDDYWTSPNKLQKQMDIMENDEAIALTAHNMLVMYENERKESHLSNRDTPAVIPFERLISAGQLMTGSLVLRKYLNELPAWFSKYSFGDYPLVLLQASYGKVYFDPEVMGVYRKHSEGLSYNLPWKDDYELFHICADVDKYTNYRHHDEIRSGTARLYMSMACSYKSRKRVFKMLSFMLKALEHSRRVGDSVFILLRCLVPEAIVSLIKSQAGLKTRLRLR